MRKKYCLAAIALLVLLMPVFWHHVSDLLPEIKWSSFSSLAKEKMEDDFVCGQLQFDEERILPILYTKNPAYALCHNQQGQKDPMGSIFTETMPHRVRNLVVYGHSSKRNDDQFTFLKRYAETEYFQQHPYIFFQDDQGRCSYYVVSFSRYDMQSDETYMGWCADFDQDGAQEMFRATKPYHLQYRQGVVYHGEAVLTLVTCDMEAEDTRFVLQAVCIGVE